MSNKTNQGILPFQMIKIAAGEWESLGTKPAPKAQSVNKINADGSRTPGVMQDGVFTPLNKPSGKSKKRGLWSAIFSPVVNIAKNHPVASASMGSAAASSGGTALLLNLFGDDDNSSKSSETPKSEPTSQPAAESKSEPAKEPKVTETTDTPTPSTTPTPAPKSSIPAPTNGTGTPAGGTAGAENKDFIDRSIQSINEFKAKHPELFWSGVGLAGLGSVYALAKALDDDDDDDDYYYYRHR